VENGERRGGTEGERHGGRDTATTAMPYSFVVCSVYTDLFRKPRIPFDGFARVKHGGEGYIGRGGWGERESAIENSEKTKEREGKGICDTV